MRATQIDLVFEIPVFYQPGAKLLAEARGLLRWKRIIVNDQFWALSFLEQRAVLCHEARHCLKHHLEKRLLILPLYWTKWARELAQAQELDADRFAAECGFGVPMMRVIRRMSCGMSFEFHPPMDVRVKNLLSALRETLHVAA